MESAFSGRSDTWQFFSLGIAQRVWPLWCVETEVARRFRRSDVWATQHMSRASCFFFVRVTRFEVPGIYLRKRNTFLLVLLLVEATSPCCPKMAAVSFRRRETLEQKLFLRIDWHFFCYSSRKGNVTAVRTLLWKSFESWACLIDKCSEKVNERTFFFSGERCVLPRNKVE